MMFWMSMTAIGSIPAKGSSSRMNEGEMTSARVISSAKNGMPSAFCTIRRSTTNTPLQALVLWNDVQFVTAARGLATRTAREVTGNDARLITMFRRCTGHRLDGEPLAAALQTLRTLQARYAADPAAAAALLGKAAPDLPAAEMAPLVLVASAFLALDATLCID